MVLTRQELAEGTKLQINKVQQLINEICVNFIHRGFKVKQMLFVTIMFLP
jgi:hypothetical protein